MGALAALKMQCDAPLAALVRQCDGRGEMGPNAMSTGTAMCTQARLVARRDPGSPVDAKNWERGVRLLAAGYVSEGIRRRVVSRPPPSLVAPPDPPSRRRF